MTRGALAMSDEGSYVANKRPGRFYFSREIPTSSPSGSRAGRYASVVFEAADRGHFADVKGEVLLRTTPSGREQVKAFFMVDNRGIRTLTVQRFGVGGRPYEAAHFSLVGSEVQKLLEFALQIRTATFDAEDTVRIDAADLQQFNLSQDAVRTLLKSDMRLVAEVVEREITERDVVAIAYRRQQLERFERLLEDPTFFDSERARLECRGDEALWQGFFEQNPWIFGYGLYYVFTSAFDEGTLQQTVAGSRIGSKGKRADALLRTRGIVSSLCFVEIKTHRKSLLREHAYRPDTWAPSEEVTSGIAQSQRTVDSAELEIRRRLEGRDAEGTPTGTSAYLLRPRSVLVVGNLSEFMTTTGVNEAKFTSFELLRRQLVAPEVITFDELLERARFIVDSSAAGNQPFPPCQ
jgi:hypothetical protein